MISIVIPNFNGANLLTKNIAKLLDLLQMSGLDFELIVVDDASSDESVEVIKKFNPIKLIPHRKNLGFPTTADDGVRAASGEYVFIIKNDAVPEKADYFKLLLGHFKDPKVFAVSAASKTIENGSEEIRGSGVIFYQKGFLLHGRGSSDSSISAWADGASSVYRKEIYVKLGGFEKIYSPGYWEDVDLGYQAWKAGYRVEFEPKAILLHDFEQSSFKKKYGDKLKLINLRNQFNFLWCNADGPILLKYIMWLPYHYLVALKNWDFTLIKAHVWSLSMSLQLFGVRAKRKGLHKLPDEEVLKVFKKA